MAFLEQNQPYSQVDIITLEFHVDYWNYLGWKDEFSQDIFTQRQQIYGDILNRGDIYTPQMIIDGRAGFTGSNKARIMIEVPKAAANKKGKLDLSLAADGKLKIKASDLPAHEDASIFYALAEDKLITDVKRGENAGQKLEHTSVVRELKAIGAIPAGRADFEAEAAFQLLEGWKKENLKVVVFIQENKGRKVIAVGKINLAK